MSTPTKCKLCRTAFTKSRFPPFCSWECFNKHKVSLKTTLTRKCLGCRKRVVWHQSRRYCSAACKRKNARQRVPLNRETRLKVLGKTNFTCVYCGEEARHADHIHPYSKGGADDESNLVAACPTCNLIASNHVFASFQAKRAYILKRRGIPLYEGRPDKESFKRPDWHKHVYGGIKRKS